MSTSSKTHKGNYQAIKASEYEVTTKKHKTKDGVHLNNLWSIWYGIICSVLQGYLAYRCLKEILGYSILQWPDGLPYLELNCSLGLNGAVFLLLPIFFTVTILKIGNLANDGYKLGRQTSTCSREPTDTLAVSGGCGLFRYGGPTAPFIHIAIAFCLLIPRLLMEAKLIQAGFLPQDYVWHTDLDFLVLHKNKSLVLSFVRPTDSASASPVMSLNLLAEKFYGPGMMTFSGANVTHTVMKTLKDIIGHEARNYDRKASGGIWDSSISLEFINLVLALVIYSVRYPALFWSANKCLGLLFSFLLFINGLHVVLSFAGISILYKLHVTNLWTSMPLLQQALPRLYNNFNKLTPFLLNAEVTFGLYMLSTLLILASSVVMYFYGHTRFASFINHQRDTKLITLQGSTSNAWVYFTHCAAFSVLISIGISNAPLLHDYTIIYRGSFNDISLICIIYVVFHLTFWICIWLFLTFKERWDFKIRLTFGEAIIRRSRSMRVVQGNSNINTEDPLEQQPLLIIGNGKTYTVTDVSPKKAIMDVLQKNGSIKTSKSKGSMTTNDDISEGIYWHRPALDVARSQSKSKCFPWFKLKSKQKVVFDELSSTSANRTKSKIRNSVIPGIDEDDGDYATLRELPLAPTLANKRNITDDNVSEEGKLLSCLQDEDITYANTSQDFNPPVAYPESASLLEPIVIHNDYAPQASSTSETTHHRHRILRSDSGILTHEEFTGRSDSISTECSVSPPEPPGSSHSEASSGVHSNESNETSILKQQQSSDWKSSQNDDSQATNSGSGSVESNPESTVVIRRKSIRPNPNEGVAEAILKEDPYGRATNMRMTSFMDTKGILIQSSSATLPHYPTQPSVQNMFSNNCSTMPLPQHTSGNIPQSITNGNSCNVYPNRPHTTIPTHLNGIKLVPSNGVQTRTDIALKRLSGTKLEPIYTKINRATNQVCHYTTNNGHS